MVDFRGNEGIASTAHYATADSNGARFNRSLNAANNVLSHAKTGRKPEVPGGKPGGVRHENTMPGEFERALVQFLCHVWPDWSQT